MPKKRSFAAAERIKAAADLAKEVDDIGASPSKVDVTSKRASRKKPTSTARVVQVDDDSDEDDYSEEDEVDEKKERQKDKQAAKNVEVRASDQSS